MGLSFDYLFFLYEIRVAISYIPVVALLSVVPLLGGLVIGMALALSRIYRLRFFKSFSQGYVVITRSIPILLQMLILYYAVKNLYTVFGIDSSRLSKMLIIIIALTLTAAGSLSEGLRSALQSVDAGQYEACYSVGMTRLQSMWYAVIPQSLPVAVPIIGSTFIGIIKGSSAAFLMGVVEMIQGTTMKTAGNYRYLEAYCAVALVYWMITILVERGTATLEKKALAYNRKEAHL